MDTKHPVRVREDATNHEARSYRGLRGNAVASTATQVMVVFPHLNFPVWLPANAILGDDEPEQNVRLTAEQINALKALVKNLESPDTASYNYDDYSAGVAQGIEQASDNAAYELTNILPFLRD